jgi:ribosome-binding ATPase
MFARPRAVAAARLAAPPPPASSSAAGARRCLSGVGLVGLPNVGKSTLFNALVRQQLAAAANFPFCTIDPQKATAVVPDARLARLAEVNKSVKVTPQTVDVVDIAGLIAGASKGDGLGNAFLANVRETSAILEVVRCFDNKEGGEEVLHVLSTPDPVRDIEIIENELALADLQSIEKRLAGKPARTPEAAVVARLLQGAQALLEEGLPARLLEAGLPSSERPLWGRLQLLTQKPLMYVCNVDEDALRAGGNAMTAAVREHVAGRAAALAERMRAKAGGAAAAPALSAADAAALADASVAVVCAQLEAELAPLPDDERAAYLAEYGLAESGMDGVLRALSKLLRQQVFYTSGPTETRAWTVPAGTTAQEAAGCIHTDLARGFIKAEVTAYDDYVSAGGEAGARAAAKTRAEGKDYVMRDADVVFFRHNG